jgi:serine protease Do
MWSTVAALAVVLGLVVLAAYVASELTIHWQRAHGQAEAEAAYLRRAAELKAEAEAAEQRLDLLDRRTHLTSLGFREMVRKVTPRVVNVLNQREPGKAEVDGFTRRLLFFDEETGKHYLQIGVGSGLVVKPGYVLTNAHVVRKAQRLRVTFASGRSVGVGPDRVSLDNLTDLAVIRLPADPPPNVGDDYNVRAEFADSDRDVERGDLVVAVGSPRGLKQTVTHGIISAKGRLVPNLPDVEVLQTDAPINPGSSGGPLFDLYGRVVGINFAIASESGGNEGIGFVIPSNTAREVFDKLAAKGEVLRGFVGAALDEVPGDKLKSLALKDSGAVLIARVLPGFPAEKAGLRVGDVLVRFNNEALRQAHPAQDLVRKIQDSAIGRRVLVEVFRGSQRRTLTIEIGRRPDRP